MRVRLAVGLVVVSFGCSGPPAGVPCLSDLNCVQGQRCVVTGSGCTCQPSTALGTMCGTSMGGGSSGGGLAGGTAGGVGGGSAGGASGGTSGGTSGGAAGGVAGGSATDAGLDAGTRCAMDTECADAGFCLPSGRCGRYAWRQVSSALRPSARSGPGIDWDSSRSRLVLFGGRQGDGGYPGDVWEFDGTSWSLRATNNSPGGREDPGLAFLASEGMVLFGGNNGTYLGDTWILRGAAWVESTSAGGPPPARDGHIFIRGIGTVNDALILAGGRNAVTRLNDTYEWSGPNGGNRWADVNIDPRPPRRSSAAAVWEPRPVFSRLLVMGGITDAGRTNEVFAREGTGFGRAWAVIPTIGVSEPAARSSHGAVWEPQRGRMLVFGGSDGTRLLDDLWEWSNGRWTERPTASGPSPRGNFAIAWHPLRNAAVLFGGALGDGGVTDETWLLEVESL